MSVLLGQKKNLELPLKNSEQPENNIQDLPKRQNRPKKILTLLLIFALLSVAAFGLSRIILSRQVSAQKQEKAQQPTFQKQTINLDKVFTFPGLDEKGRKRDDLELKITELEKTDQVVVQDKTYTAQNDKIFLIVNLEIKNDTAKNLNIFPGELVRLIIDEQEEKKFAPDLHNNYVLVSPDSTKVDRVGFVINQNFKSLKLQIGELEEKKEFIEIKFPS